MSESPPFSTRPSDVPEDMRIGKENIVSLPSNSLDMHGQPYEYQLLNEGEIRLLDLLPVANGTQTTIFCHLYHVPIDNLPPYEALSYSWDVETSAQTAHPTIYVDGQPLQIMPNLEAFLIQHRQDQDSPHYPIWIDAICINQNDLAERHQQVGLMSKLYTRLSRLIVWLGPEDEASKFVVETLKMVTRNLAERKRDVLIGEVRRLLASEQFAAGGNYTVPFTAFLKRSWFSRSWVVQEYALGARRKMVFKCGSLQLRSGEMDELETLSPQSIASMGGPDVPASEEYNRVRLLWGTLRLARVTILERRSHNNLLWWLSGLRGKHATDPRDKIYAALGLAQSDGQNTHPQAYDPSSLIIDYNVSIQDVYASLVKSVVTSTKRLNILLACSERTSHVSRSWVPDWSNTHALDNCGFMGFHYGSAPRNIREPFHSSGSEEAHAIFANDLSSMTIRGVRWGTVSDTLDVPDSSLPREDPAVDPFDHFLIPRTWLEGRAPSSEGAFVHSLWRTCMIHMEPWESDMLSLYDMMVLYLNEIVEPLTNRLRVRSSSSHLDLFTPPFKNIMVSRRSEVLFMTDNGFIGKDFSQQVRVGDVICVVLGCPVPVALRKVGAYYEFIRSVYLDAIMLGEALEALKRGEVELEDFELH